MHRCSKKVNSPATSVKEPGRHYMPVYKAIRAKLNAGSLPSVSA
jgi:hypothetical protein